MLGNRPGNTLTEAESLTFDPPAGDTTATGHISSPDRDMVSSISRLLFIFAGWTPILPVSTFHKMYSCLLQLVNKATLLNIKLFHQRLVTMHHRFGQL